MSKAILRHKAVDQLVRAIKHDLSSTPKASVIARRSVKVLDYMRGYVQAVNEELSEAIEEYETAIYHEKAALVEPPKRKSSLGRKTTPVTA
jgi:DNA-directed RNA polymerase subunit L